MPQRFSSVAVIGGGVIGTTIAWYCARRGWSTTLHDDARRTAGSAVAGGMLGRLAEARVGDDRALDLATASADLWPTFESTLARAGHGLRTSHDTVLVAADRADADEIGSLQAYLATRGEELKTLGRNDVRGLSPGLSAVHAPRMAVGEGAVDNRALLSALRRLAAQAGVRTTSGTVRTLADVSAGQVVVAAGWWSTALVDGLPIRAEKGEILRLRRTRTAPPPPPVVVRARWHGRPLYLVPRGDGVVVGATQYEVGAQEVEAGPRVDGVADLLRDAVDLMPGLGQYVLQEVSAGVRPSSPDGLPLVGRVDERTVVATGHGRAGLMLAPLTADVAVRALTDDDHPWRVALDPHRETLHERMIG